MHFEKKLHNQRNAQVFFIQFLIYFCLTFFGLSLSPFSRGTVYKFGNGSSLLGMGLASGPGWNSTVPIWPNLYTVPLEAGLKESQAEANKEVNKSLVHYVDYFTISLYIFTARR
jgi:hypothetical protein